MKYKLRLNVFETNSSSCHSISISNSNIRDIPTPNTEDDKLVIEVRPFNYYRNEKYKTNDTIRKIEILSIMGYGEFLSKELTKLFGFDVVIIDNDDSYIGNNGGMIDLLPEGEDLMNLITDRNSWIILEGDEYTSQVERNGDEFLSLPTVLPDGTLEYPKFKTEVILPEILGNKVLKYKEFITHHHVLEYLNWHGFIIDNVEYNVMNEDVGEGKLKLWEYYSKKEIICNYEIRYNKEV